MAENKRNEKKKGSEGKIVEFSSKAVTGTSNTSIKYIQKGNKFKQQNKNNNQGKW